MGFGFRQAFVDRAEQCRGPERLAQAARRTELERHAQEVGVAHLWIGEGISGNRDQRHGGRMVVEYPDRLETAHPRHENVDDHQIERGIVERKQAAGAAIGDRNLKAVPLEPGPNGEANVRIIVDNQNASHDGFSRRV
jgi:hypothetical protein